MRKFVRGTRAPVLAAALVASVALAGATPASAAPVPVGEVLTWGTASVAKVPIPEEARSGVTAISAGFTHNLAIEAARSSSGTTTARVRWT